MLNIYICEDERHYREKIKHMLLEYSFQNKLDFNIVEFESPSQMLGGNLDFDILFLDISFEGETLGVEFARTLRNMGVESIIVYITSFTSFSIEGYETEAFRYLVKPVTPEQFRTTMDSVFEKWNKTQEYIKIKAIEEVRVIDVSRIMYVETIGKKLRIHCECEFFDTWDTLQRLFTHLPEGLFAYTSKSCFVNLQHIKRYLPNEIIISNGKSILVSRRYKKGFMACVDNFVMRKHKQ